MTKVSILIPTFNSERFLDAALQSALMQTHEDLEIVVVDNASSDATESVVRQAQLKDPRIDLVRNCRNIGPVSNFRRCFERATGEYVKYLMSDDILHPNAVESLLQPMLGDDQMVLTTSRRARIDEEGRAMRDTDATRPLFEDRAVIPGKRLGEIVLSRCENVIGEPTTVLFRRAAVTAEEIFGYHGFRPRVIADVALWLTLLERGSAGYDPRVLSYFRSHAGQDQRRRGLSVRGHMEWALLRRTARGHGFMSTRAGSAPGAVRPFEVLAAATSPFTRAKRALRTRRATDS